MPDSLSVLRALRSQASRSLLATFEFLAHGVVVAAMVGVMWALEAWLSFLWGGSKKFWGWLDIKHLFDTIDVALIIAFSVLGARNAFNIYHHSE